MKNLFTRFQNDESGATAIEYGLIAAIIGVGIIVTVNAVSDGLEVTFGTVAQGLVDGNNQGA